MSWSTLPVHARTQQRTSTRVVCRRAAKSAWPDSIGTIEDLSWCFHGKLSDTALSGGISNDYRSTGRTRDRLPPRAIAWAAGLRGCVGVRQVNCADGVASCGVSWFTTVPVRSNESRHACVLPKHSEERLAGLQVFRTDHPILESWRPSTF
eukprot:scaffold74454_cov65-Phaeocystis_antarctica.AAC.5